MKRRPVNYTTRQGEAVLGYLAARQDEYVTAARVAEHFQSAGGKISRTTVYRQLERLVGQGRVRKYTFDGAVGACFQYVPEAERELDRYHLKCESCGGIFDLECGEVEHVSRHIYETHAFRVNDSKTVFYGECKACMRV